VELGWQRHDSILQRGELLVTGQDSRMKGRVNIQEWKHGSGFKDESTAQDSRMIRTRAKIQE
jgi:hypothetical protein